MLARYPIMSQRDTIIASLRDAILEEDLQLNIIDNMFAEKVTIQWLKVQLMDVMAFCGALNAITDMQIIALARLMRSRYYYLTPTELTCFFELFAEGEYGQFYVGKTINPQTILQALQKFDNAVTNKIAEIECEKNDNWKKAEKKAVAEGKTGLNAWVEYCNKRGIENQPMPMQSFIKEMQKKI